MSRFLPMTPGNIQKIQLGDKTTTLRSEKAHRAFYDGDGVYALPDGSPVDVEHAGVGKISDLGTPEEIAQSEGFESLDDALFNSIYAATKMFLMGKIRLHLYRVKIHG